ncbi:thioredoxin-like protein [Cylindrobasidium torrendii FP15055 ss-10]|uniref:Thioredoxin-like protein n=1 Tax=Cylindrobasidium torrendii FP15055 ss-10 TaxID=1314674 RepID=A0A0D7BPN6_9AGAR|nr:thioredoxin-like protein [Cylindrobasidium torrendii FP15055 ss-10]
MATNRTVKITVINDFICPNCYIGHHEMLSAISYAKGVLKLPLSFELEFRPYRLIPDNILNDSTPKTSRSDFFNKYLGANAFDHLKEDAVGQWARERKLTISFDGVMSSSLRAHRLARKAYLLGKQNLQLPFICAIFKAYLQMSQDISDILVLAQIAEAVKIMPKQQAIDFLLSDELVDEVTAMCEQAKSAGMNGVPSTIIDRKWLINGGQSSEVYVRIFKKLADCGSVSAAPSPMAPMDTSQSMSILC